MADRLVRRDRLCANCVIIGLTLMAVGASEALLAFTAELAPSLAPTAAVRSAHI